MARYTLADTKGIFPVTEQVRVNISSRVNAASIRREVRNGRDVIIVPSATLPDNVVMNGIRYPAAEIEKAYHTLENTLAPLGHPEVDGQFISASDPAALAGYYVGAHNANVRRENGRVLVDKVIDVEIANALPRGKRVIDAINAGKPIHTSTGLLCNLDAGDDGAEYTAVNMLFDHDAILLDEPGAATPEQGVGMMVNKARHNGADIDVVNSALEEQVSEIADIVGAMDEPKKANLLNWIKAAIFGGDVKTNSNEVHEMTEVTKEQFEELSAKVNKLAELDIAAIVANAIAPLTEQVNAVKAAEKAADDAIRAEVVHKGILSEAEAAATPVAVLNKLLATKPEAAGIVANGAKADAYTYGEEWK